MKSKFLLYLLLTTLCLAPVALHAQASVSTLVPVVENGPRSKQLNFVYLSDGFTSAEMGIFAAEVQRAVDYLFAREPWSRYRQFCNVYRIEVPSAESGTSDPDNNVKRNTYFGSYFWPGIDRLNVLSGPGEARAYSIMNTFVPEYDVPVVIVNTERYGGSGGPIAVATRDEWGPGLVEHETGHSFAGLGDEYDFETPGYSQFEWPNTTAQQDITKVRWKIWVEPGTPSKTPEDDPLWSSKVGHFEGANYHEENNFRAHDRSIMRVLSVPNIGQVNREAFVLGMYKKISLLNEFAPTTLVQTHTEPTDITFSVSHKAVSAGPAITVEWKLNGTTLPGETGNTLSRNTRDFGNGKHTLKAIVRDPTDWIRKDRTPLTKEITWTLNLSKQELDPPEITTPLPATYVLPVGTMITLDATATGPGPITYQWLKNNAPLNPPVTDYLLPIAAMSVADAGTYSVKISNPVHTKVYSCVVSVVDPNVPRVVVGKGKTATLAFAASTNLPAVSWMFQNASGPALANGADYANATTKALQIKSVDVGDSGDYFFSVGNYGPSPAIELLVVTGKTDYAGATLTLPVGKVGAYYNEPFPLPNDPLKTPNSFAGVLPAGLKIDAKTGRITGVPTMASKDQILGDEVTFTVGNEFGKIPVKIRMLIRPLPGGGGGVFAGRILPGSELGGTTGGLIEFTILSTGYYSGNAMIGAEKIPFKNNVVVLNADAQSATGILTLKPKHAPGGVTVSFTLHELGDEDPLTATISTVNSQFTAWRNKWLPPENVDTYKGYHTFAFTVPEGSNVAVPKGNGFGSVTIDANGKSVVAGKLADGESFTTSSYVGPGGEILVYQSLYVTATKGSLCAVLDLDLGEGPDPFFGGGSAVSWLRPADTRPVAAGRLYRSGFLIQDIKAEGGLYTPPVKPGILMGLGVATGIPSANASLTFADLLGDDPLAVNASVTLEIKTVAVAKVNTPNPKLVTFTATPADGRFKGSYTTKDNDPRPPLAPNKPRPQISRKVDYQGIIINKDGTLTGLGYFLRDSLPKADGSDTPATSPKYSGDLKLQRVDPVP